jgi:hypothetical protein
MAMSLTNKVYMKQAWLCLLLVAVPPFCIPWLNGMAN